MLAILRRWLLLSVLTLLIVGLVLGAWLGWALHSVRLREQLLQHRWIAAITLDDPRAESYVRRTRPGRLPLSWRLLGAQPLHMVIWLSGMQNEHQPPANWSNAEHLFPEAEIRAQPY